MAEKYFPYKPLFKESVYVHEYKCLPSVSSLKCLYLGMGLQGRHLFLTLYPHCVYFFLTYYLHIFLKWEEN